jgi:hypothetical protein
MVSMTNLSVGFSVLSALISIGLLGLAVGALRGTRNPNLGFLVAAFAVFALKSLIVAYAIWTEAIAHETLELVDGAGDLITVLLIASPLVWPRRSP